MNAWHIACQFVSRDNRWLRNFCLPNFTPRNWWECDVFEITAAGYFVEYEIKISRSDFFADAGKTRADWPDGEGIPYDPVTKTWPQPPTSRKHDLLAQGCSRGPSKFYFMTPENLVGINEVPSWAGLIYCKLVRDRYIQFDEVRKEPRLHKEKADAKHREGVYRACYSRLHSSIGHKMPVCSMEAVPYEGPEGAD